VTRRLAAAALALLSLCAFAAQAQDLVAGGIRFHFATREETSRLIVTDDDWTATAGTFHRAAIAGPGQGTVSDAEFKRALASTAMDCSAAEVRRWGASVARVAPKLRELKVGLPATVTFACTNGQDATNAPHTRGDAVYLPQELHAESDDELVAHELVHIFSRRNPAVADRLYGLIGFTRAPELAWPPEWSDARLSNPDAPTHRHTIRITVREESFDVMPVLVAQRLSIRPGQTIFNVMDVRLLAVEKSGDGRSSAPLRRDGQPLWFPAFRTPAYVEQLGGNTHYVIHPEETIADNIAYLVSGRTVPNPALLEKVRRTLADSRTGNTQ
jgi:hypothetical protein